MSRAQKKEFEKDAEEEKMKEACMGINPIFSGGA